MRRRNLPPRMHAKGRWYYHVTSTEPRIWTKLCLIDDGVAKGRALWARIEGGSPLTGKTIADMIDAYCERELGKVAPSTQASYARMANRLRRVFGPMRLSDLRPSDVATFLDTHRSPSLANNEISLLSVMHEKAMRWGWITTNPCKGIRKNPKPERDRYITDEEYHRLRAVSRPLLQVAMDVAYLTGMRQGDLRLLRLSDVTAEGLVVTQGKTKKKQTFVITPALENALKAARSLPRKVSSVFLFANPQGQPYTEAAFRRMWWWDWRKSGVEDVHWHDLRAKAATDAKRLGMDYQTLLGHTQSAMSDRYVKRRERDQVQALPAVPKP